MVYCGNELINIFLEIRMVCWKKIFLTCWEDIPLISLRETAISKKRLHKIRNKVGISLNRDICMVTSVNCRISSHFFSLARLEAWVNLPNSVMMFF